MESPFRDPGLSPGEASALEVPSLEVIETLAWDGRAAPRAARHLDRAQATCRALGFPFDRAAAEALLAGVTAPEPRRLRLTFHADGAARLTLAPLPPPAAEWVVALAPVRLDPDDPWLRRKTSRRALYDTARANLPAGVDEAIFANRRGEICEGTISNLFFDMGSGLRTPPLACGLLPGVLRAELLETGRAREAVLTLADLGSARLWCGNALRGLIPARLG